MDLKEELERDIISKIYHNNLEELKNINKKK